MLTIHAFYINHLTLEKMKIYYTFNLLFIVIYHRYIHKTVLKTDSLLLFMSFSLLVQRKERKERTPHEK